MPFRQGTIFILATEGAFADCKHKQMLLVFTIPGICYIIYIILEKNNLYFGVNVRFFCGLVA